MSTQCSAGSLTGSKLHPPSVHYVQTDSEGCTNVAAFDQFLSWLDPDPESAGLKYESIRARLIMMFRARRCVVAEDLADATIDRVARKLNVIINKFTGDPTRYFYGVARKIYLEYQRQLIANPKRVRWSLPLYIEDPDFENVLKQLDEALSSLPKSDRELILSYYTGNGRNRITKRRALAQEFGLGPNALRLRVFRIRKEIKQYLLRSNIDGSLSSTDM